MDAISKIKAELERRIEDLRQADDYYLSALREAQDILSFIKSTEKEQRDIETAAICVWESWNGGTMDDVRRDMDALGKLVEPLRKATEDKK